MQSTPSLPLILGPLCPGVVALDRDLSIGQIELNCGLSLLVLAFKLRIYAKLDCFKIELFRHLNYVLMLN